jgi:hypothetical protein
MRTAGRTAKTTSSVSRPCEPATARETPATPSIEKARFGYKRSMLSRRGD